MITPIWALERIKEAKEKNSTTLNLSRSGKKNLDPITEIHNDVFELSLLTSLDLSYNELIDLPEFLTKLKNLKTLDLNFNKLASLPEAITKLQNLKTLDLSHNQLASLPESIGKLQNLKKLRLDDNQLTNLPESISELENLTLLNLYRNQFASLPESIGKLKKLTNLDLGNNKFVNLPDAIIKLQILTTLDLSENQLSNLPEAITKLQNLTTLDLSDNQLASLPESIGKLQNLTKLGLSGNQLSNLPEAIIKLQNLTKLDLSLNRLISLPEMITKLRDLKELFLFQTEIAVLPESIIDLQNLNKLNIGGNQVTTLPETITKLQNLTELRIHNNQLVDLPESITELQNLKVLTLGGNRFTSLPEFITKLHNLIELHLSNNQLVRLPESITKLQRLTWLSLSGNQLVAPPQEVAEKGIESVREYFRQVAEQGQDQLYEAKLLILGEGGAGKTTLAKKIKNSNYVLQDENSTKGVDVITWSFPIDEDKQFRVNIWDFGGQEIYHATHQFFLTKRSLYALVADTRKEDTDFYYWLNAVDLLSDNSPLLIIKNEKQDRHRELNERQLRGQFENLKEILTANFDTNRGLDKVKAEIEHYLKNLPHIGSPLPKTWVRVRERLENDQRNYISLDEYLSISKEYGFTQVKDTLQLSEYLHVIGVFLHFQDEPLLKKMVILKPEWVTDAVYKVLDNKMVIKKLGRFTRVDLNNIWDVPEYENMHDELLQLMMKFKLCYEIPAQKGNYIAPQLLTENQPEYEWNEKENLLLRYNYEFMPKGILLQFIVVMSENISKQTVWKSGVVVEKDKTRAEVIEFYGKRQIHVRVAGAHMKELMTIIIHELDEIHNAYKRLKYDKLIPCNCTECRISLEPHFYRYEQLQTFIEKHIFDIQCGATGNMVNVRGLVDDVQEKEYSNKERESLMNQYIVYGDYIDQGDKKMTENKISIKNSTIHGSVVAAENIKDSFNTIDKANIKDDLKEQLKQLTQAVEAMIKDLPKDKAEEVAEDMKVLAEQATKEKPNPKWYNVSIDGLVAAAQNLGKVGDEVIELTSKVRKILTGGI
ncbi:MAG: COR domain-containing protein [Anaerolineales bacterium]